MPMIRQQFPSVPPVRKEYLRIFYSSFVNIPSMIRLQVGISKAFLQSDYLHPKDKVAALLPEYIGITGMVWEGWLAMARKLSRYARDHLEGGAKIESLRGNLNAETGEIGMLLNRPLREGADAHLRWHIAISRALRKAGYEVLNSDRCLFANMLLSVLLFVRLSCTGN